ncbi:hypothetical protein LTR56_027559, partial [Elasticomyces elasticus]
MAQICVQNTYNHSRPKLQTASKGVRLLLTSRPEEDFESTLREWIPMSHVVSIQQGPVDIDVREVVRNRIATDAELKRWQSMPEVCTEIEGRLMEKADGMGSLVPSAARMDGHKAVGKVWSDLHDNRLLQPRGENELPWKRIAGPYFRSTDLAWLQR